jgi:hypothetical protein
MLILVSEITVSLLNKMTAGNAELPVNFLRNHSQNFFLKVTYSFIHNLGPTANALDAPQP